MPTAEECICCAENHHVQQKMDAYNAQEGTVTKKCIIEHPGFQTVYLDQYVLETAYSQYNQQYGLAINNGNE